LILALAGCGAIVLPVSAGMAHKTMPDFNRRKGITDLLNRVLISRQTSARAIVLNDMSEAALTAWPGGSHQSGALAAQLLMATQIAQVAARECACFPLFPHQYRAKWIQNVAIVVEI
jgi:hypothetical protein